MSTNRYAVIGHPIAHTMSPFIHTRLFELSGRKADYFVFDIAPDELAKKMMELKALDGFNITIPHKQAVIPFLNELDKKAAFFNSVNTVKNGSGCLSGHTTDGTGFCKALEAAGENLNGRTVILGAGGAARAMAFEAVLSGGCVTIATREHSMEAARALCADLNSKAGTAEKEPADCCLFDTIEGQIDLLVNATPVGMYPNTAACPVSEQIIQKASCVFDAVYNPNQTILLKLARKNGIKAIGGMSMLVWQAAAAHEIWYGAEFRTEDIERLCSDAVKEMKKTFGNIVLCGYMGSGKTSVGQRLAEVTGRTFVDMDRYIEQNEGITIAEIFARSGEAYFRRLECGAAETLSQKSNLVIATGGGTLMNPVSTASFKGSGVIVLLDAQLSVIKERLMDDKSRPMLASPNRDEVMERLYGERIGTYRAAADFVVSANDGIELIVERIKKILA